ncbi:MAG TPA: pyridoxal-5-phosphate-dependent protein subunit beta, partial [Exilispira sp.]|nr:pyridoxal-5-phosphate-dependent protein subunit beta [Exilispira sp.]
IAASEALQCPTLLENGFGGHRIEGIGDKHVPWIHNVKNTDMVIAIDDSDTMSMIRLFNEQEGKNYLLSQGISNEIVSKLDLLGISGCSNLLSAIKFAKYYELNDKDVVFTVLTDSMELYQSRLIELNEQYGRYTKENAAVDYNKILSGSKTDNLCELNYRDRKRIHNLKYFTWVEQQGKTVQQINELWYDDDFWTSIQSLTPTIDKMIEQFNQEVLS